MEQERKRVQFVMLLVFSVRKKKSWHQLELKSGLSFSVLYSLVTFCYYGSCISVKEHLIFRYTTYMDGIHTLNNFLGNLLDFFLCFSSLNINKFIFYK